MSTAPAFRFTPDWDAISFRDPSIPVDVVAMMRERDQRLEDYLGSVMAANGIPAGGATGEVLTKLSNTDYDVGWAAAAGTSFPIDDDTGGTNRIHLYRITGGAMNLENVYDADPTNQSVLASFVSAGNSQSVFSSYESSGATSHVSWSASGGFADCQLEATPADGTKAAYLNVGTGTGPLISTNASSASGADLAQTLTGVDSGNKFFRVALDGSVLINLQRAIGTAITKLGFFNVAPVVRPTISSARNGEGALKDVLTALKNYGLILDSSTASTETEIHSLTAQTADIADTNFTNSATAGLYRVHVYLIDTTSAIGAGAVQANIKYTDVSGAQTQSSAAVVLTTAGSFTQATFFIQKASGSISYGVTHTGIFSTSAYALYVSCEQVG